MQGPVIVDAIDPFRWQQSRSALEFHGDVLAQRAPAGIVLWDSLAMQPIATHALDPLSFCFMRDGSLAALVVPPGSASCVVYRFDGGKKLRTLPGPQYLGKHGYILPATGTAGDYYYVLRRDDILVLDEVRGRVEEKAVLDLPERTKKHLVYSLGDGRLVIGGRRLHILDRAHPVQTKEVQQTPKHIVPMPGERCWYAFSTEGDRIDVLALAPIADPAKVERRVTFAHEHVVHMASAPPGDLAVLVLSMRDDIALQDDPFRWVVLVYDAQGRERWHVEVPPWNTANRIIGTNWNGFVAISEHRVVLRGLQDTLFVWDAANGAPTAVRTGDGR